MSKFTRRRTQARQNAGSFYIPSPFTQSSPVPPEEETFEQSEDKINMIINNVQTTRQELQDELEIYEKKLTLLEQEFLQYQHLAMKVLNALKVLDSVTQSLAEPDETSSSASEKQSNNNNDNSTASAAAVEHNPKELDYEHSLDAH
jgi:hypothetical protein